MGYPVVIILVSGAAIAGFGFLLSRTSRAIWIGVAVASSIVFWMVTRNFNEGSPFDAAIFIVFMTVVLTAGVTIIKRAL